MNKNERVSETRPMVTHIALESIEKNLITHRQTSQLMFNKFSMGIRSCIPSTLNL